MDLLRVLAAVVVPGVVFAIGAEWQLRRTERTPEVRKRRREGGGGLNKRFAGYDETAAHNYWTTLGEDGRLAEEQLLKLDLRFPFVYGGALLAGLGAAWWLTGQRQDWVLVVTLAAGAAVLVTMVADRTENTIHLEQLARYRPDDPLTPQRERIRTASNATRIKLFSFIGAYVVLLGVGVTALCNQG